MPLTYTKSNPAQRSAEVVDEARSGRAVLILKGGATERVRDGVCFGKENAVANDTKSATTCLSFTLKMPRYYNVSISITGTRLISFFPFFAKIISA